MAIVRGRSQVRREAVNWDRLEDLSGRILHLHHLSFAIDYLNCLLLRKRRLNFQQHFDRTITIM